MLQMKEQDKTLGRELSEAEIRNLLDEMLKEELSRRMDEDSEKVNKEL